MPEISRRSLLAGIGATAVAAAVPLPTGGYETETFREAERLGIIGGPGSARFTLRITSIPWNLQIGDCLSGFGLRDAVIVGIEGYDVTVEMDNMLVACEPVEVEVT